MFDIGQCVCMCVCVCVYVTIMFVSVVIDYTCEMWWNVLFKGGVEILPFNEALQGGAYCGEICANKQKKSRVEFIPAQNVWCRSVFFMCVSVLLALASFGDKIQT